MVRVRRPSVAWIALAAAAVLVVAIATTGGSVPLATEGERAPASSGDRAADDEPDETGAARLSAPGADARDLPGAGVIAVVLQTTLLGLVVLALAATVRPLVDRRGPPAADHGDDDVGEHWPPPADVAAAVDQGLAAMRAGRVDDAVIACWVTLEEVAADAGAARGLADTPAELAARVLADLHAPPEAVDQLLRRYRQARFSRHRLDEADRDAAIEALQAIRVAIVGART